MKQPLGFNRAVAILVLKKPFFDWLRLLLEPIETSRGAYDDHSTVSLAPKFEGNVASVSDGIRPVVLAKPLSSSSRSSFVT